ncbi:c-type cytochrome biogenesis protein CcmI [Shimwellia pseudoproteus]|uniref:c-type cytochrome biogenesis protein CcmI n=1 Tax=Shimwellia pseudoproteus TaxID=570012 RepID=UPI0018EC3825|nr:c-type cytochrome biogenesis protein CcmI [Shimwellia pseudoproteus]MBJ3814975.1 c-type cytochrome biogenesis protein CcmI [Shimwellia pseudoproteus]
MSPVIIVAVLLLLVVLAVLFIPWSTNSATDRDTLNQRFYRSRLDELAREGHGPDDALVVELQRTLLDDIPRGEKRALAQAAAPAMSRWVLLPGALVVVLVSGGLYWHSANVEQLLQWQHARAQYPQLLKQVMDPQAAPLREDQLASLALGLRSRLQDDRQNIAQWRLLGRIGVTLNDNAIILGAFSQAWQLAPKDSQVTVDYAGALVRSGEQGNIRKGELLLRDVLAQDANNVQALDLLAFSDYLQQRYDQAAQHWKQALALTPADDPQHAIIAGNLRQATLRSQQ